MDSSCGAPEGIKAEKPPLLDWVLLDLDDVIVHALIARAREFYRLEKPGSVDRAKESEQQAS